MMEEAEAGAFWRIYWPGRVGFTVRAGTPGATTSLLLLGARPSSPHPPVLQSHTPHAHAPVCRWAQALTHPSPPDDGRMDNRCTGNSGFQ